MPHKVACFVWLLAKEVVLTQDNLMKKGIPLCSPDIFSMGNCRNSGPSIYTLQGHKSTMEIIPKSQKTYLGPCQGKSQKHYAVGKKQEYTLRTETTGELYLQLYGGQYGRRGTLEFLRIWRIIYKSK
ncbi:hypothetical protein MTR67_035926 [Solanum verrucosum]|uniref:Uncharacterized protein n=1 Tax=Solanum verrucosum TaxID=315347 RepID=A0AAF0ZKE5_SOLVR|nr:hypothetical protein MTR67_035926 [Solanum verrucosum]